MRKQSNLGFFVAVQPKTLKLACFGDSIRGGGSYESVGSDNNTRVVYTYTRRYRSVCLWGEFSLEVQLYLSPCAFCCAGRRQLEKWARHPLYLLLIWYICGVRVLVFLYYQMNRHCRPRCIPPTVKYM